ncbi:hypothetical protein EDB81DRAFT_900732 [Dactylonectria macrodidyma]|uniref:Extracellular membrane protein CFEM domain-containing protein n=1 Tax=Dactylonectria macrodidyma TaxID=307937 RepID=A0A9P9EP76_9HYPO|nr:hypothetical protein EDB81DRAFT_900732 [Dactylonectria macrodidyma]
MRFLVVSSFIFVLLLASPPVSRAAAPATFTIDSEPDYDNQRRCGKACMWEGNYWIGGRLGCDNPAVNDCMCRTNLASAISSYATSCLETLCTVGDPDSDISTFLSLYNSYCAKNGYTLPGAAAFATETEADAVTTIGDSTAPTVTRVTFATVTGSSSESSESSNKATTLSPQTSQKTVDITRTFTVAPTNTADTKKGTSESGLSRSDKIALGVGIGFGLPATIAGIIMCCVQLVRG